MATSTFGGARRSGASRLNKIAIRCWIIVVLWLALASHGWCKQPKDFREAKELAEQGDMEAQGYLGRFYATGSGVPKSSTEAVRWYRKAAEQGDIKAQHQLANCYGEGIGVPKDLAEAIKWLSKAAVQGNATSQLQLGNWYYDGFVVPKNLVEAAKWYYQAANQGLAEAQFSLSLRYGKGEGVPKNLAEAVKWCRKAAEQGLATAQFRLGVCYDIGDGVSKDSAEAVKWFCTAAQQNDADAQNALGHCYFGGNGVPRDYVEGYKWINLSAAQGHEDSKKGLPLMERLMTADQIAEAQKLTREFKPRKTRDPDADGSFKGIAESRPSATGTGFFITSDGFAVTNAHVVKGGGKFQLVTRAGIVAAKVVKVDTANDIALLKAEGSFFPLSVATSRAVRLGSTVATVGFPNIGLQGFAPKLAKGEIAALSGVQDDARYFQISVPVQPGNSGGALVDEHGNVVGIVAAKLDAEKTFAASGQLPENVNYAVKSSFLLGFLESIPDLAAKLTDPNTKDAKFEDVVKSAEQAAVLVLVY